jgi:hypothetical protein
MAAHHTRRHQQAITLAYAYHTPEKLKDLFPAPSPRRASSPTERWWG